MRRRIGGIAIAALLLAACSAGTGSSGSTGTGGSVPASILVTVVQNQSYGPVLTGPTGRSLYVRVGAGGTPQTCTGDCRSSWPPLLVAAGGSVAGDGHVPAGSLSTVVRADDGSTQVTSMGVPLYYWSGDANAAEVTGSGVNGFLVATAPGFLPLATPCQSACSATPAASPGASSGY